MKKKKSEQALMSDLSVGLELGYRKEASQTGSLNKLLKYKPITKDRFWNRYCVRHGIVGIK